MKKFLLLPLCATLLTGCDFFYQEVTNTVESVIPTIESLHSYDEVLSISIKWSEMFSQSENEYYVYFYSETCSHCNEFKDTIIEYALEGTHKLYFVKESSEFSYTNDPSTTIGATSCDDFAIKGFPSLALLSNSKVIKNVVGLTSIKETLRIK